MAHAINFCRRKPRGKSPSHASGEDVNVAEAAKAKWGNRTRLGGELPTNRSCGLVHPSYLRGRLAPTYPINKTRVVTHLLSGMNLQVLDESWLIYRAYNYLVGGLEHQFLCSHSVGNVIIPSDELIFFRGVGIQPPTSNWFIGHTTILWRTFYGYPR